MNSLYYCTLCGKKCLPKEVTVTVGLDLNNSSRVNKDEDRLKNELQVMFLLRKILEIPQEICCIFLAEYGNPYSWIDFCDSCSILVQKGKHIFDKVTILQQQYKTIQNQIQNQMTDTQMETNLDEGKRRIKEGILSYINPGLYSVGNVVPKEENIQDLSYSEEYVTESNCLLIATSNANNVSVKTEQKESFVYPRNFIGNDCDGFGHYSEEHDPLELQENGDDGANSKELEKIQESVYVKMEQIKLEPEYFPDKDHVSYSTFSCESNEQSKVAKSPKRLVVEVELLRACILCNAVFPTLDLYREHVNSTGHRATKRAKKREDNLSKNEVARKKKNSYKYAVKEDKMIYQCAFCPEKFSVCAKFRKHRLQHLKRSNCLNCPEKFVTDRKLVLHYMEEHDGEHIVKCDICNLGFLDYKSGQLRVHVRRQHLDKKPKKIKEPKPYNCDICGEKILGMKVWKAHIVAHKDDKNKCLHCPEELRGYIDLEKHYNEVHNGELPFPCQKCPQKFITQCPLQLHEENNHGRIRKVNLKRKEDGIYPCPFCNEKFSVLKEYTIHTKTHKMKKKCLLCNEKFMTDPKLVEHYIANHDGQKIVRCSICDKGFLDYKERSLKEHIRDFHGGKKRIRKAQRKYTCDICGEKFLKIKILKNHLIAHNEEKLKCVHCGKEFDDGVNVNDLENHYKEIHDGNLPFQCKDCSQKFLIEYQLQLHMKREHSSNQSNTSSAKSTICDICGLVVKRVYDLPRHKATHMTEEERHKFYCEYCGKSFLYEQTLVTHTRTHTGENPYPCTICGDGTAFHTLEILKNHNRRAHNSFRCDICGKSFKRQSLFNDHRKSH